MVSRFLVPARDSLWQDSARRKYRWAFLGNLIWVVWVFGDLFFGPAVSVLWWLVTVPTLAVLLVLFVCIQVRPSREVQAYALAMVAMAYAVMPVNNSASGVLVIYGCAYLAMHPRFLGMALRVVPILSGWLLEAWLLHWPWQVAIWMVVIALMISVAQHAMWARMCQDAELRLSHDEVRRLAASAERERIGRDLHDLLGHTLSMVALKSELAGRLIERDPRAARREIADVERVAREALAQVRSAVSGIRAAALASEFASARLLLESAGVHLEYWSDGAVLPPDAETCLAMVLREAVTNVQRHARADRVEVTVTARTGRVVMRVHDNGRGGVDAYGNGLTGMRERIAARGGEIAIDSPRDKGTCIEVSLPLPTAPAVGNGPAEAAARAVNALPVPRAATRA